MIRGPTTNLVVSALLATICLTATPTLVRAAEHTQTDIPTNCHQPGHGGGCVLGPNGPHSDFQAYKVYIDMWASGHGDFGPSGGKVGFWTCLSDTGGMWRGPCFEIANANSSQTVSCNDMAVPPFPRWGGIGDLDDCHYYGEVDIDLLDAWSFPARYQMGEMYANDATWGTPWLYPDGTNYSSIGVGFRRVSNDVLECISNCNPQVGQSFTVQWDGDWNDFDFNEAWADGAVGSNYLAGIPGSGTAHFTCTSAGVAHITTRFTGPTGSGATGDAYRDLEVECIQPLPGPISWLDVNPCQSGPDKSEPLFELSWSGADNAEDYLVQHRAWSNGNWLDLGYTNNTAFENHEAWDTDWYYRVIPRNAAGFGPSITEFGGNCPASPEVDIRANNQQSLTIPWNTSATLSWSTSNASSCWANGGPWSGNKSLNGSEGAGTLTSSQTYTIRCRNGDSGFDADDSVTITVEPPPAPTVDITADGSQGPITIYSGGTATLNWTSSNAATCNASGRWSGGKPLAGSDPVGPFVPGAYNYVLTCSGDGGSTPDNVQINVPTPTGSISANPNPCQFSSGTVCTSNITWNTGNSLTPTVCVKYWPSSQAESGSWTAFSSGPSGTTPAPWIQAYYNYRFSLFSNGCGNNQIATVIVTGVSVPSTSNVSVTLPDYCTVGPSSTVNWTYSDPVGATQTAYQVQVDDNADYSSPIVNTGQINSPSTAYTVGTGILNFNQTYRARVRTLNQFNQWSGWTNMSICTGTGCAGTAWTTPVHAYPNARAPFQFTWSPTNPPEEAPVQFTDHTQYAAGSTNREWSWTFTPAGGGSGTSTEQNPVYSFNTENIYQVTQSVRDNAMPAGQYCTGPTQAINVQKPIPIWLEVAPR